ncbi:hypothetical protein ACROYT_G004703 [Oculina patagonica]
MIKPLALVVKKRRPIFRRPYAKSEFIVTEVLENYVEEKKKQEFTKTVNKIISKEENPLELAEEEDEAEAIGASSHVSVKLEAAKTVKVNVKVDDELGELELGKLDEEYLKDPDLREVLAKTALDANRMEGLEDQKLRLIYSVIYSERFLLKGKRQHEIEVDAGIKAALPEIAELLSEFAQLKGQYRKKIIPPKAATRNTRGPVFFKFVRVDYDKENGRLKLSDGEFAGRLVNAEERGGEKDKAEYAETVFGMEKEDIDFSEPLTDEDIKKLLKIVESGLVSVESSREKRKERVKKYLSWFEEALMKEQQKISVDEPLTDEDCEFLRTICCPALPSQSIVDLSPFDAEKIQGYAIVLKQIDDLSDEHWAEIEKAWAQPGQNK